MFVYDDLFRKYGIYLDGKLVRTFGKGEYKLAYESFTNLIKDNLNSHIKLVDSDEDKAIHEYEPENFVDYKQCSAVAGFNTKQVWVYDEEHNVYIDPPKEVIDFLEQSTDFHDFDAQESLLNNIIATNPDWLQDKEYTYDAEEIEI